MQMQRLESITLMVGVLSSYRIFLLAGMEILLEWNFQAHMEWETLTVVGAIM